MRIKSAAALAIPSQRSCYGDVQQFRSVWSSLATALENSEDTNDFLEYRYSASLRHTLSQALLHLLSVSQRQDMAAVGASLAAEEGMAIREHLIKYVRAEDGGRAAEQEEKDEAEERFTPQQRLGGLQETLIRLKGLTGGELQAEEDEEKVEERREVVVHFLEDLLKTCEEA